MERQQVDFFISYTGVDESWAQWIAWQLTEAGYEVLLQAWHFGAGSNFVQEMHEAARHAHRTIAVLSPDFLESEYAAPEWQAALVNDPRGLKRQLVPVRVRPCQPRGLLSALVYVDLVGLDRQAAIDRLVSEIQGKGRPEAEPRFPGGSSSTVHNTSSKAEPSFPAAGLEFIIDCSFGEFDAKQFAEALQQTTGVKANLSSAHQNAAGRTIATIPADDPDAERIIGKLRESPDAILQLADTTAVRKISWFRGDREHVIWIPDPAERQRRRDWLESVRLDVLEEIEQIADQRAVQRLARLVGLQPSNDGDRPTDSDSDNGRCEEISDRLIRHPELVRKFRDIRTSLRGKRDDLNHLEAIEDLLLPVWFGPEVRDRFYGELTVDNALLVEKAAATTCGLEYEMAVFDGRPVAFSEARHARPESRTGRLLVRHVPAAPKDPAVDESVLDIIADLAGQLIPQDLLPETELVLSEQDTGQHKPRVTEQLLPAYAARLTAALQTYLDELGTPYCAIRMPESRVQRDRRLHVLTRLRELVPELVFLELHPAAEIAEKETTLITRLQLKIGAAAPENARR